jgi:hypothetical protein
VILRPTYRPTGFSINGIVARHAFYNATATLAVQGLAIVVLVADDYGVFALYYLAFAFGTTLCYSVLSEAWFRTTLETKVVDGWPRYCTMLTAIGIATLVPVFIIFLFVGNLRIGASLGGAVALATYRVGARFYAAASNRHRYVGPADLAGAIAMVGAYFVFRLFLAPLETVSVAWFLSALVAALLSERPRYETGYRPSHWIKDHRRSIKILMTDSIFVDLGSVGMPFALSPMLGIASFGVFRSVSSAAVPVRLILNPLRPLIGRRSLASLTELRILFVFFGGATIAGGLTYFGLSAIGSAGWFSKGVIFELAAFALPVGIFVCFNMLGTFYYLVARMHVRGVLLLQYRALQLFGTIAFPFVGLFWNGLTGAIWGFTLNSSIGSLTLVLLVIHERSRGTFRRARPERMIHS